MVVQRERTMAVSTNLDLSDGLYVPFRGVDRVIGPVGTLQVAHSGTGDATGGAVVVGFTMARQVFGFHAIWVPTHVQTTDDQAAATTVSLEYPNSGNERLSTTQQEVKLALANQGFNTATFGELAIPIEPDQLTASVVLRAGWTTNVNLKVYNIRAFGAIYDMESMARGKAAGRGFPDLLIGIR